MSRFALRVVALACCVAPAAALTPDAFYAKTAPSVWLVKTFDEDGLPLATGTAVVIAPDTVLTNCHVLVKAKRVSVRQDKASHNAKLQYADVDRDLCQLAVADLGAPAVPVGDSDKTAVGQHVYALGNPQGFALTLSDGLVSALRKDDKGNLVLIQTTAPISQGSSGGGLFDDNGRLIGITSLLAREGQNLNFAYPINWLRDLPERSAAAMKKRKEEIAARADAPDPRAKSGPPQPSGYAEIGDVAKVPANARGKEGYLVFLGKPYPRAFAVGERGAWGWAWGARVKSDPSASPDPAVRALQTCEKRGQRCVIYALDDVVVYQNQFKRPQAAKAPSQDETK